MQMPRNSGLDVLDKVVRRSMKYYSDAFKSINIGQNFFGAINRDANFRLPTLDSLRDSVDTMVRSLNNAASQLLSRPEKINYNTVVKSFMPPGARLLKPQYPENSNEIQFVDLDGDKRSEMIASYKTADGIRTMILKSDDVQWYKLAEIHNPDFEEIHYRNNADMSGDGAELLLLGLVSKYGARTIFAYSLADGDAKKIFSRKYSLLELHKQRGATRSSVESALALWNEESPEVYDIELVRWNGLELEQLDHTRYLEGKVIPYYVRKLRQNPGDTAGWYNLANAMAKTGDRINAASAIDLGLERDPDAVLKEKFNALKMRL